MPPPEAPPAHGPALPPRRLDAPARLSKPGQPSEPVERPAPEPPPRDDPAPAPAQVKRGRSIVSYKRPELVEIVGRIAEREPDLSDDQIVELVTRLLGCPEDEALLVGARLRYAVGAYREQQADPG